MFSKNSDDENVIESKKKQYAPSSDSLSNTINFISTSFKTLLAIIIQFILGALILFGCKVSQSNILPTDTKSAPYTDIEPQIKPIETNIFIQFFSGLSKKINFPYKNDQFNIDNSRNMIIDILRKEKHESKSNTINFFISLVEGLFSFNYSSMGMVLQVINYLPELLILLIGPLIFFIFLVLLLVFNNFYLIYLWLSNLGWFFKEYRNNRWENIDDLFGYGWCVFVAFMFFILMWILLGFFLPFTFLSLFVLVWTLVTIFTYEGIMDNTKVGMSSILVDVFKYYKSAFINIFSLFFVINAFSMLGVIPGIFIIIAILLIIFDFIHIDIFKSTPEQQLSKLVSTERANRDRMPDQTGGGSLFDDPQTVLKELKKINKSHNKSSNHVSLEKEEFAK
jgi:hypothetical protein